MSGEKWRSRATEDLGTVARSPIRGRAYECLGENPTPNLPAVRLGNVPQCRGAGSAVRAGFASVGATCSFAPDSTGTPPSAKTSAARAVALDRAAPGFMWDVLVDRQLALAGPVSDGLITFEVPAGDDFADVRYGRSAAENGAGAISIAAPIA